MPTNLQIRSPYCLRPRFKVVRPNSPTVARKVSFEADKLPSPKSHVSVPPATAEECLTMEQLREFLAAEFAANGMIYKPRKRLSVEEEDRMREENDLMLATTGLSYLNDPRNGDAKYELVSPVAGCFFLSDRGGIYHSNFVAKLKNDPKAKAQLFFLEIVEKVPGQQKVTRCCSLGQSGSKAATTGLKGCRACYKINHPNNARFVH